MITNKNDLLDLAIASIGLTRTSYRFLVDQGINLPNIYCEGSLLYALAVSAMNNQLIQNQCTADMLVMKNSLTDKPVSFFHMYKVNIDTSDKPIIVYCDSQGARFDIVSTIQMKKYRFPEVELNDPELASETDIVESGFPFDPILVELLNDLSRYQMARPNASSLIDINVTKLTDSEMQHLCKGSEAFKNDANTPSLRHFLNTNVDAVKYYKVMGDWLSVSY